jgi:hypothetical protein
MGDDKIEIVFYNPIADKIYVAETVGECIMSLLYGCFYIGEL